MGDTTSCRGVVEFGGYTTNFLTGDDPVRLDNHYPDFGVDNLQKK